MDGAKIFGVIIMALCGFGCGALFFGMGVWAAKRTRVLMEGEEQDVEEIYHRFFIRFLTTGG